MSAQGGIVQAGNRAWRGRYFPLHNWVISLETGTALGTYRGSVRTIPLKRKGERLFAALDALANLAA